MSQIKYILISFLLFSYSIFSQSIQEILGIAPEFYIDISNSEILTLYNFEINKIGTAYCFDVNDYPIEYITECIDCGVNCADCDGGLEEDGIMTDSNGNNLNGQNGFGFCAWGAKTRSPHYGYGVYKLLNTNSNKYIYIDTRDDKYTRTWINGYGADFRIKYEDTGKWFWKSASGKWEEKNKIFDKQVINIWTVWGKTEPNTDYFPSDYWKKCLIVGKVDLAYPHLIWSKYPGFANIDSYELYIGMVNLNNNTVPDDTDYILLSSENHTIFDYEDSDDDNVGWINASGGSPVIALYYVKAKSGTTLSPRTNIVPVFSLIPWSNALILINENNNPSLIWDEYKGFDAANISGYKIYRGMPSPIKPSLFIFNPIATVTKDEIQFIDHDIFLSSSSGEVRYYVKAILSQGESSATNTVSANGGLYKTPPPAPRSITQRMNLV